MAFSYTDTLTIDHTQVSSDLTNFPTLVSLSGTWLKTIALGGNIGNSNGYDIQFFSDSGLTTKLNWEVEFYDGVNGILVAWVQIPTVSSSSNTVFYIGYGDVSVITFQGNVTGTWDSNYAAVYHFAAANLTGDSTSNANNGTNIGVTATAGQIDGGAAFNGSASIVKSTQAGFNPQPNTAWSISGWVKTTDTTDAEAILATWSYQNTSGVRFAVNSQIPDFIDLLLCTATPVLNSYIFVCQSSGAVVTDGNWHLVVATFSGNSDASGVALYVDGQSVGVTTEVNGNPGTLANSSIYLGEIGGSVPQNFNGNQDELRAINVQLSSNWIAAEYANQKSGSTFVTLGSETPVGGGTNPAILTGCFFTF